LLKRCHDLMNLKLNLAIKQSLKSKLRGGQG
jgi:hypothetical protein